MIDKIERSKMPAQVRLKPKRWGGQLMYQEKRLLDTRDLQLNFSNDIRGLVMDFSPFLPLANDPPQKMKLSRSV
jgi:hypothetical protein